MEPKSILCFGDSNTWGMAPDGSGRLPFETRWPNQLQHILNQRNRNQQNFNHQPWIVYEQGLNSRTWVMDDPLGAVNYGGDYSCNGRQDLPMVLHSCKPLDIVILALGCNDCKSHLHLSPEEITSGAKILIHDVRMSYRCGPRDSNQSPTIVLMSPGVIQTTPQSLSWGFKGASEKSKSLPSLYRNLAEQESVFFFNTQAVAETSPIDGVHFGADQQNNIASGVADLITTFPA